MDKVLLQHAIELFVSFGDIKSRSMFGGFGIFCGDTMFALMVGNKLYLRGSSENEQEFAALGMEAYCYTKRGFPVITKYFAIPAIWWKKTDILLLHAKKALKIAQSQSEAKKAAEPSRIKDLPNLRLSTERMLKKAGIDSVEKLQSQGALAAFRALQATHGKLIKVDLLWSLEGALTNTHSTVISPARRNELLAALKH